MEIKPLISIIVPVYNAENYLEKCINSVLKQTYTNIELILVNDGSKDNSFAICEKFKKLDKRIKVLSQENSGVSKARNQGLDVANGEFVGFIDSDDYVDINMYESLIKELYAFDTDIVQCRYANVDSDGKLQLYKYILDNESIHNGLDSIKFLFTGELTWTSVNKLYKRDAIGDLRFPENISMCEDFVFLYNVLKNCKTILYVNDCYYYYFDNPKSQTKIGRNLMGALVANEMIIPDLALTFPKYLPLIYRTMCIQFNSTWEKAVNSRKNEYERDISNDLIKWSINGIKKYKNYILKNDRIEIKYRIKSFTILYFSHVLRNVLPIYRKLTKNK